MHTHARTHTHTHARTHACTHARTHTHCHSHPPSFRRSATSRPQTAKLAASECEQSVCGAVRGHHMARPTKGGDSHRDIHTSLHAASTRAAEEKAGDCRWSIDHLQSPLFSLSHTITPSLPTRSLHTPSLLTRSHPHSSPPHSSYPHTLTRSHPHSSLPLSSYVLHLSPPHSITPPSFLTPSHPHTLTPSHPHTLTPSLPLFTLQPSRAPTTH